MNNGDVSGRTRLNAAERIVRKHGGQFGSGEWCRATGLTETAALALRADLTTANYQIRSVIRPESGPGKWEVIFR